MGSWFRPVALVLLLAGSGCAPWPTEDDIADSLEHSLRSVSGEWHARSLEASIIELDFQLHEDSKGNVKGTGSMHDPRTGAVAPFTVAGSYRRPVLQLTFLGLVDQGERARGTLEGAYTTVGGISTTLYLTGPGFSRSVAILLQEK